MTPAQVQTMIAHISELLADRLGATGHSLSQRLDSRARALPRRIRQAVRVLATAEGVAASPKMVRHLDLDALQAAYDTSAHYLEHLNAGRRFWGRARDAITSTVFGVALMAAALGALALWLN
ncbi:hypothetical protein [Sedimentimonas flavescens]|uniref:hypothetical protein n=1 Tax=Sedimentimonas flavescens TaxID=2851012 RepID=UPI001C4A6040|nr:hypothetical protein [Sedimentimonas flavescens]MBW0156758.1 hypothetical protein [Sedimentimonas flavescens]WBL32517.1 hypothetical protein O5O51_12380 [Sinirhodobacter sp. HNIBRBA609]